jgi:hypothetical protein
MKMNYIKQHDFIVKGRRKERKFETLHVYFEKSTHSSFNFSEPQSPQNEMICAQKYCCLAIELKFKHGTLNLLFNIYLGFFPLSTEI